MLTNNKHELCTEDNAGNLSVFIQYPSIILAYRHCCQFFEFLHHQKLHVSTQIQAIIFCGLQPAAVITKDDQIHCAFYDTIYCRMGFHYAIIFSVFVQKHGYNFQGKHVLTDCMYSSKNFSIPMSNPPINTLWVIWNTFTVDLAVNTPSSSPFPELCAHWY